MTQAHNYGNKPSRDLAAEKFIYLLQAVDALLKSHPLYKLENWIDFARSHGETDELKNKYEANARRLITRWGPPVDDYSARMWSGSR